MSPHLRAAFTYGGYEILGRLAEGLTSEVFLGREPTSVGASRLLTVERVRPEFVHGDRLVRFLDEARMALQLDHPNLAHVYEFGERDGACFVATEWIDGVDLSALVDEAGPLPPRIAARLAASLAAGLEHAHHGRDAIGRPMHLVHGHLDAREVIVAVDGRAIVRGFCTSRTFAGPSDARSPEGALGGVQDARSDVFAIGACLHHTLSGAPLFPLRDPRSPVSAPIAGLDPKLAAILERALATDPAARFASAGALEAALLVWIGPRPVPASAIAALLDERCGEVIAAGPRLETVAAQPSARTSRAPVIAPRSRARPRLVLFALALLGLGLLVGWLLSLLRGG